MPNKNLTYFIDKFTAIPESKWTTGEFHKPNSDSYCALGHCGIGVVNGNTSDGIVLQALLRNLTNGQHRIHHVNDDSDGDYKVYGKTPKQRVVNFLIELRAVVNNKNKKVLKKKVKATKKEVKKLFTEIMGKAGLDKSDDVVEKVRKELASVNWGEK